MALFPDHLHNPVPKVSDKGLTAMMKAAEEVDPSSFDRCRTIVDDYHSGKRTIPIIALQGLSAALELTHDQFADTSSKIEEAKAALDAALE